MVAEVPSGARLDFHDESIYEYEKIGIPEMKNCCFVLVAGGLGERLGYSSIKIGMPIELITHTTFIQYYCENILEI
jgi:UDP-sugar pyrophosphorylase